MVRYFDMVGQHLAELERNSYILVTSCLTTTKLLEKIVYRLNYKLLCMKIAFELLKTLIFPYSKH